MGPDYYSHTTHLSIHEAGCIAHVYWLNHTDYCRKAFDWLVIIIKENEMINEYRKELAYAQSAYDSLHAYYKAYNERLTTKRKREVENTIGLLQRIINVLHYKVRRHTNV